MWLRIEEAKKNVIVCPDGRTDTGTDTDNDTGGRN
jgi:hypothetical protein